MPNLAITRAAELDELLERTQAEFDVLKEARELCDARAELVLQVEEIDRKLAKFDAPLRRLLVRAASNQPHQTGHGG